MYTNVMETKHTKMKKEENTYIVIRQKRSNK